MDEATALSGPLSLLMDGTVQLDAENVLGDTQAVSDGLYATLVVAPEDNRDKSLGDARVRVENINGNSVTISFAAPDSPVAQRYREVIVQGFAGGDATPATFEARDLTQAPDQADGGEAEKPRPKPGQKKGTDDARKPLPASARYARMLEDIHSRSREQLAHALPPFLDDLDEHLQGDRASRASQRLGRNVLHDTAEKLAQGRATVVTTFIEGIEEYFSDLTPDQADDQLWKYEVDGAEELDLIDLQEYEDFLLIDRVVSSGEEIHQVPLEALTLRLAEMIDVDPNTLRNPIHVRQICRALQSGLNAAEISRDAHKPIFDFFGKKFVPRLQHFYAPFNEMLADEGVLHDIEARIEEAGTLLDRKLASERPDRPSRDRSSPEKPGDGAAEDANGVSDRERLDQAHQQLGEQITDAMGRFTAAGLYKSVVDALNFKREAEGLLDSEGLA
ncbi:MAG: DUF1631 family protein, partial [Halioglobus sp.]|nr:DUF1631 family protein [Halioglobus sp.]